MDRRPPCTVVPELERHGEPLNTDPVGPMQSIKITIVVLFAFVTGLWLMADTFMPQPFGYFPWRHVMVQYSGVMAMTAMSAALILALRPRFLEGLLGGLDKMYRLHKWLGVTALAASAAHWIFAKGTKWAVGWGWLIKPPKGERPVYEGLEALLRTQRGLAETLGEWVFYVAMALVVLALIKRFPYHLFAKTHKVLAAAYLILVFHGVILMEFSYWSQPVGVVMAVFMAAGGIAAVMALTGYVGRKREVHGRIKALSYYPEMRTLKTCIEIDPEWPGHDAGQFAFVTSNRREGAHPYTIASAWHPGTREITFITKGLGDHTGQLHKKLAVGDAVTVEGPYGRFNFADGNRRQIWIGAGIGITPFLARLQDLARGKQGDYEIDLFHPVSTLAQEARQSLERHAQAAGVRLHLMVGDQGGRLSGERLRELIPDWKSAGVWFCGPAGFGRALREDLVAHGLRAGDFHQELFEMR